MKLNELIANTLTELEVAKQHEVKKKYLIDEVTLEVSLSSIKSVDGGVEFKIFNIGTSGSGSASEDSSHKVIIKLKPRN